MSLYLFDLWYNIRPLLWANVYPGSRSIFMPQTSQASGIGPTVRRLRQERKLSQEALAAQAEVSSGYLSKLERGLYKQPSYDVLSRIASALSMSPAELYRAAGLERLLLEADPELYTLLQEYEPALQDLPRRDQETIMGELRRILHEEKESESAP